MVESTISAAIAGSQVWHQCLFSSGSILACQYDPAAPAIYLSLGDTLAASGLIFAAYQLADRRWKIRHGIHWYYSSLFLWLGSLLGIVSAVIASSLPVLEIFNRANLLSYPLFWEILSLSFFVFGVAHYVVVGLFWTRFFGKTNAENYTRNV